MRKFGFIPLLAVFALLPGSALAADGSMVELIRTPVVEGILAAVILLSLAAEIKTAGFSGGSLLAALAGCILIGADWYAGENTVVEFVLYFGGMALILLDILVLMSGVAAAAGLVALLAGLFFTFGGGVGACYILAAAIVLACIGGYFVLGHLSQSRLWQRITLHTKLTGKEGYVSSSTSLKSFEGKSGTAASVLRPAGKVNVEGHVLDAVSDGDFIEKGDSITVVNAEGNHVVVRKL